MYPNKVYETLTELVDLDFNIQTSFRHTSGQ